MSKILEGATLLKKHFDEQDGVLDMEWPFDELTPIMNGDYDFNEREACFVLGHVAGLMLDYKAITRDEFDAVVDILI